MTLLTLGFDLTFLDLYEREGLIKIDQAFQSYLAESNPSLFQQYQKVRQDPSFESDNLLVEIAPYVEDFIARLFNISADVMQLQKKHHVLSPIFSARRQFVQRYAVRRFRADDVCNIDAVKVLQELMEKWDELIFAEKVLMWLEDEQKYAYELEKAALYASWAALTLSGQRHHSRDVIFKIPRKVDPFNLLTCAQKEEIWRISDDHLRLRDGFSATDTGFSRAQALAESNYCIFCHHQGKDSCSKGLKPKVGEQKFQQNELGTTLTGCPLEEKISEMHEVKSEGYTIGALAIITIDNPMVAATGHRICNDCMKSCIYQKQEPVNIPGTETQTLKDVLNLPWGFEIYSLLTRWNPLNFQRPLPLLSSGYNVLVIGMGPAGFTLAHHLLNDGHTVIALDGLKIEPLPSHLNGVDSSGDFVSFDPIHSVSELFESLDSRITGGFGGVAEYGITVRWDKNFLKIIRLLLERRRTFSLHGGIRFGGTLSVRQAFEMGFDHIALCMGAGRPTLIPMKNGLAKGVRQASDFLMALQLTGAAKAESVANLQVRLPAVVIGGGLTAIDTATEIMAYYPVQVEKFWKRHQVLENPDLWSESEQEIAHEFLAHGRLIAEERSLAEKEGRLPNFVKLVQEWGGVTIAYRRDLTQAPSYTLNHEEVEKGLEEGIFILDQALPLQVEIDEHGYAVGLRISHQNQEKIMPARSILIAAGTKPNTNLIYDNPDGFVLDGQVFQAVDETGAFVQPERSPKPDHPHVLMQIRSDKKAVSFFGDLHPSFAGNVVKAMSSAKQGYPVISRILKQIQPSFPKTQELIQKLNYDLRATVYEVNRLTPTIVEVVIKAPLASQAFQPGQFFRLQNYETYAPVVEGTKLAMEGLALTGAKSFPEEGLLSTIVLEMGGSSRLCSLLKPGEPIVLMGPTGSPTEIPSNKTVLLIGGGLGNAVLFSIGQELRANGNKVLYVAGYKKQQDRYKIEEIEAAADHVIWCCDESPGFTTTRPQDFTFVGNIVEALMAYGLNQFEAMPISLQSVEHLIVIGSDRLMAAVAYARHTKLKEILNPSHQAIGSINSPMQCMMKEICAQCLQRHVDPITKQEKIVYSCANQDQPLDWVDFKGLSERLQQNNVQEKLTDAWVLRCLELLNTQNSQVL